MAFGDVIARLAVSLSLETAALEKGADLAEKRFEQSRKRFETIGKRMQGIGVKMTAAFTAPLAGLGYALAQSTKDLVETSRQMRTASQVAGESFEEFQRLAFGAKTVGIEADKLGDIFKDVQDKVGDFRTTGGGPMADFFENIAPKVNLTAEAFKNLGGKDALQLYYDSLVKAGVSSDQMRFYMEAIASDATMLIPLLENGGKAFDEFGKSAAVISEGESKQLEEYAIASQKMEAALQKLTIALVGSGLLEAITGLVTGAAEWVGWLSDLNPEILNWAIGIGGVLAALGPLVAGVGTAIKVGSGFLAFLTHLGPVLSIVGKAMLLLAANPVILAFAGVIAGIYLAWKNWDKIEPILRNLYQGAKKWIIDNLIPVIKAVLAPIQTVQHAFYKLWDNVVGHSYIPDMVDGIAAEMARLDSVMVDPATRAAQKTSDVMRDMAREVRDLLDRLFPEIGLAQSYRADLERLDRSGLSQRDMAEARRRLAAESSGVDPTAPIAIAAKDDPLGGDIGKRLDEFSRTMDKWSKRTGETTVRVAKSFKDMADETLGALQRMTDAIKDGGFLDILESVIGFGLQLGSIGVFGKKVQGNINASVPGYATGTTSAARGLAWVGERGPELVSFRGGERVWSNRDSMAMGSGGVMEIRPSPLFEVYIDGKLVQAAPALVDAGGKAGVAQMAYRNSRSIR